MLNKHLIKNWGDIYYINYYGWDVYTMGVYSNSPAEDQHILGGVVYCSHPSAQPLFITVYAYSFTFITCFSIIMVIIGCLGDAMMNTNLEMNKNLYALKIAWHQKDAARLIKRKESINIYNRKGKVSYLKYIHI